MNCELCGKEFFPKTSLSKYCSRQCYNKAKWGRQNQRRSDQDPFIDKTCLICKKDFRTKYNKVKLCSKECISVYYSRIRKKFLDIPDCIEGSSRKLDKILGYVRLYVPMHHEANSWGYVYEHRIIAEQIMGRRLQADEIVHHKNGKRWDNRPENLEVMNKSDHARLHGQREEDRDI